MTKRSAFASTILVALVLVVAVSAQSATAQRDSKLAAAEWAAIKKVIGDQRAALVAGEAAKAFAHAAPGIRAQFGTPDNFLAMVQTAYGPLITARYTEFLEGAVIEGVVIQPLRLIAPDNAVLVALYTMEKQKDGSWKIAGCVLAPSTVQAA